MTPTHRILAGLVLVACHASIVFAQATLPRPVIRDSAGVRIIEYPTLGPEPPFLSPRAGNPLEATLRILPPAFHFDPKPFVDIGGLRDNELEELDATHPMFTAATLSDGTVVVNDKVRLKFFTSGGKLIRAVGRAGGGPGEFGQTKEVCRLRGDSLLVIDISSRLTLWDAQGKQLQTYARPGNVQPRSCLPDGSVIVSDATAGSTTGGPAGELSIPYRIVRPDGSLVRDLGPLPAFSRSRMTSPTVKVVGDQLLVATGRTWELRMQDFAGRVRRITRFGKPPISVTVSEWQTHAERSIARTASPEDRKRMVANRMANKPDTYPAYQQVYVDPAGRFWVQDFYSSGSFTVLDTSGVLLGRFVLPGAGLVSRKALIGVGADHVVVFDEDGDGAVHVKFHKITPIANAAR